MTTSYATGDDFIARYDRRLVGDLVRDDATKEPASSLPEHPNLLAMLSDAYGKIVSVITVGDRYTLEQIDPVNLSPSGIAFLVRLNCDLALLYLKQRRGKFSEKTDKFLKDSCDEGLKALKDGATILLGIRDLNAQASVLGMAQPELLPIAKRNTIRFRVQNYYPIPFPNGPRQPYTTGGN